MSARNSLNLRHSIGSFVSFIEKNSLKTPWWLTYCLTHSILIFRGHVTTILAAALSIRFAILLYILGFSRKVLCYWLKLVMCSFKPSRNLGHKATWHCKSDCFGPQLLICQAVDYKYGRMPIPPKALDKSCWNLVSLFLDKGYPSTFWSWSMSGFREMENKN